MPSAQCSGSQPAQRLCTSFPVQRHGGCGLSVLWSAWTQKATQLPLPCAHSNLLPAPAALVLACSKPAASLAQAGLARGATTLAKTSPTSVIACLKPRTAHTRVQLSRQPLHPSTLASCARTSEHQACVLLLRGKMKQPSVGRDASSSTALGRMHMKHCMALYQTVTVPGTVAASTHA